MGCHWRDLGKTKFECAVRYGELVNIKRDAGVEPTFLVIQTIASLRVSLW